MNDWVETGSHDWRKTSHRLSYYGVKTYVNLSNGAVRAIYNDKVFKYDQEEKDWILLEEDK